MKRRWSWRRYPDEGVEERIREGGRYILIVGTALALLFTWLTLSGLPYADAIANTKREYIQRITLVVFYFCWVSGTKFDLSMQKAVYLLDPNRGQSRVPAVAVVGSILAAFAILLWVKDDEAKFAIALAAFVAVNVLSWQYFLRKVIRPIIGASRAAYRAEGDYVGLEKLFVTERYIGGDWQWRRFAVMAGMILVASVLIGIDSVSASAARLVNHVYPAVPADKMEPLVPAAFLALFVLVAEGWMWLMRVRTRLALQVLDELGHRYDLTPAPERRPPNAS